MATFRQRGQRTQAQVKYPDGTTRSQSFATMALAKAWAAKADAAKAAGEAVQHDRANVTVADLWAVWLPMRKAEGMAPATVKKRQSHWTNHVEGAWATTPVRSIRKSAVRSWVGNCRKAGMGVPTIEGALGLLSALLAMAVDDELMASNPAAGIGPGEHTPERKVILTPGQMARMLAQVTDPTHRLLLETMAVAGLRIGEALGLRAVDVDAARGVLNVRQVWTRDGIQPVSSVKGGRRDVPVPTELLRRLSRVGAIGQGRLFAGDDRNLNRRVLAPACRAAGVPRVTLHGLRHYAATQLLDAGQSPFHVAKALGHKDTRMIDRTYGHDTDAGRDLIRQSMTKLHDNGLSGTP